MGFAVLCAVSLFLLAGVAFVLAVLSHAVLLPLLGPEPDECGAGVPLPRLPIAARVADVVPVFWA